ncbi:hypothetical protein HanRHA438_Chr16g0746711 [Helianthus annuus]|nr:hypothetical protein HanOQP8_Chr16g0606121 [Helianthus annuus]KAJ0820143.1 hypothetical protein HanPSC8_Chr16g0704331 [Helianthus annuus]KAJ0834711.1 hypothetical protein HanRHA438_Chr16g0746711 [Helianthus annuus]
MMRCDSNRHFYPLTSFQIGDLQSYLSDLSLFLAPDSKEFYVLVDNRPWLEALPSRPAHLWQLMVTKSRMSPFANTRGQGRKGKKDTTVFIEQEAGSKSSNHSKNLKKWFSVINAATLSKKRALLPVKKLRSSLLANSKLHRTLFGFIVFQVAWKDVRGINYVNELQTDTSLAIEAKYMKRWEFDSINQAVKCINTWFPGTPHEQDLLEEHLNSMLGDEFHDASSEFPDSHSTNDNEKISNASASGPDGSPRTPRCNLSEKIEIETSFNQTSIPHTPPPDGPYKRRKLMSPIGINMNSSFYTEITNGESVCTPMASSYSNDCEETTEPMEYKDALLMFRFNDHDLPFELQKIILSDIRLLTLLEAGLPSWVIFCQSYPVFCHIYRPWMCPLARALYVAISIVTVVIGFYDLYKNVPVLKATASRLCGPLFDWIETWEMVSRIKYLGTMLFLHNSEKAVMWFLMMTRTVRSFVSIVTQPLKGPFSDFIEVIFPVWTLLIQTGQYLFSFVWVLMESSWDVLEDLIEVVLMPVWFVSSVIWIIVSTVMYPIFWCIWGMLYAPVSLILGLSNFVGYVYNETYDLARDIWLVASGFFKLASNAESAVNTYEVSIWRSLWNDLFSQVFRAVRSILNGFVAFFTACNRHRLSIYNHSQELIRTINHPAQRPVPSNSSHRSHGSGNQTRGEAEERKVTPPRRNLKQS